MTVRLIGAVCEHEGCRRPRWLGPFCARHYYGLGVSGRFRWLVERWLRA